MAGPSWPTPIVTPNISAPPWASLPDDLIRLVSSRLLAGDFMDYIRFRAVCTLWRQGTASPCGRGVVDPLYHPRRWMMFPLGNGLYPGHQKLHHYVRFFNLDTGAFVRVRIPLFVDHCVLDSFDGLLVLQRDEDSAIRLLHPFTGDIVELPSLSTLIPHMTESDGSPTKGAARRKLAFLRSFSTAATFVDGVVTVMLALSCIHRIAFATSQDRQWFMSTWSFKGSSPPFSSGGKIYVAYNPFGEETSKIFQMDTPLPDGVGSGSLLQPPKLILTCPADRLWYTLCFVECDSEILVIGHNNKSRSKIVIFKLADLIMEKYIPVTTIEDMAIFIGERSLSVNSKALPTITGNTVVYSPMQYHLSSGIWSDTMDECSLHGVVPGPCSLIHHILTCCSRKHWNKGLLLSWRKYNAWLRWPVKAYFRQGA